MMTHKYIYFVFRFKDFAVLNIFQNLDTVQWEGEYKF